MKNKGFTLIELLAVIVILAIIALIAAPIVLNIISDTKESATKRSAEFYLDAVEMAVAQSKLKGINIGEDTYPVMGNGNICIGTLDSDNNCLGANGINDPKDILEVEISGEVPEIGSTVTIGNGEVTDVELKYNSNTIPIVKKDGKLEFDEKKASEDEFVNEYELGEYVKFNPGDVERTWNVIDEDETTVTLLLNDKLGELKPWLTQTDYTRTNVDGTECSEKACSDEGPVSVMETLNALTADWGNVDPIASYSYINNENGTAKTYGYQKIEINNGTSIITDQTGNTVTLEGETKARLITTEEIMSIAAQINSNFSEESLLVYLNNNIELLNEMMDANATDVKDLIQGWVGKYFPEYSHYMVYMLNYNSDIPKQVLPSWIYENLILDDGDAQYWTLSTVPNDSMGAWVIHQSGFIMLGDAGGIYYNTGAQIRPVITIKKEGSNIIKI